MFNKKKVLNINGLLTLAAINKYQSKRKAANAMGISVDTMNRYLATLEASLGLTLLQNSGKGYILTSQAKSITDVVDIAQNLLEAVCRKGSRNGTEHKGHVRILMPLTLSSMLQRRDLNNFFERYPDIRITSVCTFGTNSIEDESVDLAGFIGQPANFDKFSEIYEKEIPCGLFAAPSYIHRYGHPKDLKDLCANHRLVNKIGSEKTVSGWKEILDNSNSVCFQSNSPFSLLRIVRNGAGIGLMPLHFKNNGFVHLENIDCRSNLSFHLLVNKSSEKLLCVQTVANYYKRLIEKL